MPKAAVLTLVLLAALSACKSREDIDEVSAGAAQAASSENLVSAYARRVKRAEKKLEDYAELAQGIETRLRDKRSEVRELRAEVGRRAQEIQGLRKEVETLDAEIKALQKRKAELAATSGSERQLVTKAEVELHGLEEERRGWALRLEEARAVHEELAAAILPLLAMLPRFDAEEDGLAAPTSQPAPAPPTSQPAPAAGQ